MVISRFSKVKKKKKVGSLFELAEIWTLNRLQSQKLSLNAFVKKFQ